MLQAAQQLPLEIPRIISVKPVPITVIPAFLQSTVLFVALATISSMDLVSIHVPADIGSKTQLFALYVILPANYAQILQLIVPDVYTLPQG